ncbi:MAG: ABC transporter permease [Anaerolineae bacterium]|nr:ABC transporter permease [Anaerolineae bacterium]MCO5187374.1 ABC transporter permease [Anaerolineae bacterium]MCO5194948.1 ABC transporter permease [Anaerolineae bacterium]MCO5196288.1 ABC transporter permease [Anaerolineae bacterium]MCO5204422.1 ABC transporter permease [Anaerolineae bacterium]
MIQYIIRRILISIPVLFFILLASFLLVQALPGGPFDTVGEREMPENMRRIMERRYGLDKPVMEQFVLYASNIAKGDLGPLMRSQAQDVNDIVAQTFPVSFQLGIMAVMLGFIIGIPAGILAALYHNSPIDYTATFFAVLGVSIPNLVLGPILIYVFAVSLGWFPVAFWGAEPPWVLGIFPQLSADFFWHAVLPVFALGTGMSAVIARLTRAGLLEVLSADYIRTARSKGLRERSIIIVHALKNSLIPVATLLGPLLAGAVTGSLVIEQIFALNGMGRKFISSIGQREYFLLTSLTIIYAVLLVAGNLFVDILYGWLDPRIRYD